MAHGDPFILANQLRRMAGAGGVLADAALVRRFAELRDEAAFEVLVWRHGPMVWATCRRTLRQQQDAEDAFQATFLALARHARRIGRRESVGGWLHRVALNAALKLRARRKVESELPADLEGETDAGAERELCQAVDAELDRLPDHYRAAFVLCCLEGLTNAEAAKELGCPVGTVDSRLHAARTRLRDRLSRRGFASAVLGGLVANSQAPAAVTAAAIAFATSQGKAKPAVEILANQLGTGLMRSSKFIAFAAALTAIFASVAVWAFGGSSDRPRPTVPLQQPVTAPVPAAKPKEKEGPGLLFTEMVLKPGETGSHTLRLVLVRFQHGKLAERQELYTGDASEFGYQAKYRIISGRYVVFESATVIDCIEKKVVHQSPGERLLRVEGTKVYSYMGRDGAEQGVYSFDAGTGKREKVAELAEGRWGLRGAISPDGTKAISREWRPNANRVGDEVSYNLSLSAVDKKPATFDGLFSCTHGLTGGGTFNDVPPGVWIDDKRFLTQTTLGKVVILNVDEKTQSTVVEIPPTHKPGEKAWDTIGASGFTPLGLQQPRFSLLPDGRVMYEADIVYFIDVAKKTWEKAEWRTLGHGFEFSALPDKIEDLNRYEKDVVVTIRHNGKAIGTSHSVWWSSAEKPRVVATEGHIAIIERLQRPGNAIPLDAIRLWSAETGEWTVLDTWADSVIGWLQ
jgi:RNA polymerase sigma factor (sigma-70 family)